MVVREAVVVGRVVVVVTGVVVARVVVTGVVVARVVVVVTAVVALRVVVEAIVVVREAVVVVRVVVLPLPPEATPSGSEKVDPSSPILMLEKVTEAFGELATRSSGFPEVVEQVPRETPGADGSASTGYGASSHRRWATWSDQMDMVKTCPRERDCPMALRPP